MKLNLTCFLVGLVIMLVSLYRMVPIDFSNRKIAWNFVLQVAPLCLALFVIVTATYMVGGTESIKKGFMTSLKITSGYLPVIIFLFPVMAFGGVLAMYYKTEINQMLTGSYGHMGTLGAAFIVPTSNTVAEPVKMCWENQALRPLLLYFLTTAALVCWPIFFFRTLGLTFEIGWKMYLTNWIVAIGIMPFFWVWSQMAASGGVVKAVKVFLAP